MPSTKPVREPGYWTNNKDVSFDKALSANSLPFWPDQETGVREMWRVLKPGGVIAIILQPRWATTESEVKHIGAGLLALLSQVGFYQAKLEFKPMRPIASVCAWHQVSSALAPGLSHPRGYTGCLIKARVLEAANCEKVRRVVTQLTRTIRE